MNLLKKSEVIHIAKLAKIELSEREVEKFRKQLSEVVSYVNELNEVNTSNVIPTSQTTGLENKTKNDDKAMSSTLSQEEALSGTENVHNGYFVVPMILEERSDY